MKNKIIKTYLVSVISLFVWLGMIGCSKESRGAFLLDQEEPLEKCVLMLHTGILESRSEQEIALEEKIHTLRTIIVSEDGTIEYNDFLDFGEHPQISCYRIFEVKPEDKKTIYFVANENGANEDLTSQLNDFSEAKIENMVFTLKEGEAIPMSVVYEVEIPKGTERVDYESWLVHAATKISYRFKNYRLSPVTVNKIEINQTAQNMYLLPHVGSTDLQKTFDTETLSWIEWLKRVSDESQALLDNPDLDPDLATKRGWITDYSVPDNVTYRSEELQMNITLPKEMAADATPICSNEYYMHESRYIPANNGQQQYTMTFHLTEGGKEIRLTEDFTNLKALFRNTHVLIDVDIASEIVVRVIPYAECKLKPIFGLDVK